MFLVALMRHLVGENADLTFDVASRHRVGS
jgi:hypothetical protein